MERREKKQKIEPQKTDSVPRRIIVPGSARSIACAKTMGGSEPAWDYYQGLSQEDRDKFSALFITMAEHGKLTNTAKFRAEVGEIKCDHGGQISRHSVAEFKIGSGPGKRIYAVLVTEPVKMELSEPESLRA